MLLLCGGSGMVAGQGSAGWDWGGGAASATATCLHSTSAGLCRPSDRPLLAHRRCCCCCRDHVLVNSGLPGATSPVATLCMDHLVARVRWLLPAAAGCCGRCRLPPQAIEPCSRYPLFDCLMATSPIVLPAHHPPTPPPPYPPPTQTRSQPAPPTPPLLPPCPLPRMPTWLCSSSPPTTPRPGTTPRRATPLSSCCGTRWRSSPAPPLSCCTTTLGEWLSAGGRQQASGSRCSVGIAGSAALAAARTGGFNGQRGAAHLGAAIPLTVLD